MPKNACPQCLYTRFWRIRRDARRCKRCRTEYRVQRYIVSGICSTNSQWKVVIAIFLRMRTITVVVRETGIGHSRIERMLQELRRCMYIDKPEPFIGVCEADETFIGG